MLFLFRDFGAGAGDFRFQVSDVVFQLLHRQRAEIERLDGGFLRFEFVRVHHGGI